MVSASRVCCAVNVIRIAPLVDGMKASDDMLRSPLCHNWWPETMMHASQASSPVLSPLREARALAEPADTVRERPGSAACFRGGKENPPRSERHHRGA